MSADRALRPSAAEASRPLNAPAAPPAVSLGATLEHELIERARTDSAAFAELYRRNYALVANHVWRRTADRHVTEDVVSVVFHKLLRRLPRYRTSGIPLRFFLLKIAGNEVNRWVRSRARSRVAHELWSEREAARSAAPERADAAGVRLALACLPLRQQSVLSLHYLDGLSVVEVAGVLGCRPGTIKSRLSRARAALKRQLDRMSEES